MQDLIAQLKTCFSEHVYTVTLDFLLANSTLCVYILSFILHTIFEFKDHLSGSCGPVSSKEQKDVLVPPWKKVSELHQPTLIFHSIPITLQIFKTLQFFCQLKSCEPLMWHLET